MRQVRLVALFAQNLLLTNVTCAHVRTFRANLRSSMPITSKLATQEIHLTYVTGEKPSILDTCTATRLQENAINRWILIIQTRAFEKLHFLLKFAIMQISNLDFTMYISFHWIWIISRTHPWVAPAS